MNINLVGMKVIGARLIIAALFIITLIFGLLVSISVPVNAAPQSSPSCPSGVGIGGTAGVSANQAGHGCVIIKYNTGSADVFETFSYTGADQSWTSPSGVTSLTFYLLGAGGGANNVAGRGPGGSGGFATGTYAVSTATTFKIIVGQGGNGNTPSLNTYGGGGKADFASGGGRSAIRLAGETEDLITAGGAGGGGLDAKCGGAGGGTTGQDAVIRSSNGEHGKGGTQTAGGAGGYSVNGRTGGTGVKYQGGLGQDESGGGGGGYWGGGGGGDNTGAGGGSGYLHPTRITSGELVQGTCTATGNSSAFSFRITYNGNQSSSGTVPDNTLINAFSSGTLASNTGNLRKTGFTTAGWNTRADGTGTSYPFGSTFTPSGDTTLYAEWLSPSFNTDTSAPIGVLGGGNFVVNTAYTDSTNDLVLTQFNDKIQIVAVASAGTVAITTTTRLTLPIGYQSALNTAASTISFIGSRADVNAALATLKYTAPATAVSGTIKVYAAHAGVNGDYRYNHTTESSYWRGSSAVVWADAYNPTTTSSNCGVSFNGMCGYMTIPNDVAETQWIASKLGTGWIGITDAVQGAFKYVANAPNGNGTATFTYFASGEGTIASEQYVAINYTNGYWVDLSTQSRNALYEFGGKDETPTFAALTRTINFGALAVSGTPTLDSTSDTGTSSTDKITNDNTPTINIGSLTVGATVTLTAKPATGSSVTCSFTASATTGSCTFPTMADGTYSITATQTLGGTTTDASTALANVQIDTVRPTVTLTSTAIVSGGNSLATPAAPSQDYNINSIFSEVVHGFVIGDIGKNSESTGWAITTTALSTSALSSYTFNVRNATGAGNAAGKLFLSIAEGVATDVAGNTNTATTSSFIINTVIQLNLTNQYQAGISPVVGGNNATIVQSSNGAALDLTGQGGVTRANHTFAGWSLVTTNGSGAVIPSPYIPTVPLFLYSSWVPNTFIVSYNANGGNGTPDVASENYTFGSTGIAITSSYNRGTLSRTGYTFAGWSTTTTGAAVANPYVPTASVALFARWTAGNYTVTFNGNNSTSGTTASSAIVAGTAKALTANGFARVGYTFAGWNTASDGTGTSYANQALATLFGDTTLYAQWTVVAPGAPAVTAASAGNTTVTATVTDVAPSGTTIGPSTSFTVQAFLNDGTLVAGKTCTFLATASPLSCVITGLTNGTIYKFKATATNSTSSATGSLSSVTATPAGFTVTYDPNGGSLTPTSAVFTLGTPLVLPLPTRSGYNFTGWNNPSVGLNGGSYSPTGAVTLTAQWSAIVYTITYNGNGNTGGSAPSAGSFSTGGSAHSISTAGNLAKTGYDFDGWTTGANGSGTAYAAGASYSTSANLVLYAKWTPQVYTITYDKNGAGGAPSRATDSFTFGSTPLTLPAVTGMTYANYTFGGWSESQTGTAVVSPYSPTQTRTLYAIWSGISYSVSFNVNGGTGSVADAVYVTGATGLTLSDGTGLSRTGYTFGGWRNLAGTTVSGSPYVATENVTLYAIWTPKTIVVTYDKGIATTIPTIFPASPVNSTFGANFTLGTSDTSTVISSGNYAFAGWKIGTETYKPGDSYRIIGEAPITVTAQWIQLFEVTYNTNGGTFAGGDGVNDSQCVSRLCTDGQAIQLNLAPTRTGFTFVEWVSQTGANFAPAATTNVSSTNYIFYATWTPNSYTINFAAGTGSNGAASAITDSHGSTVQLAASTGYSLSGSIFTGWLIGATTYPAGAFYTMGTDASPITATAQYANNTFKIFYNTNGSTAGTPPAATTAASGAAINLDNATGFSRIGFTFNGWSNGTDILVAGFGTTMGSANSTLIAQWQVAIPTTPTISTVTGSDGGATITVAAGSGGGAPSSYTVTSSPAGGSCTITAPATTCSVSPLTNGTAYTFSVTATNSTGTSAAATSAAITPAGKPDAPTGVTATIGNGSATVSFVAPATTGGPAITGYTITSSPAGATCSVGANATTYSCTGLNNGTAYTFAVSANNGVATSDASTSSLAVTPATVPGPPTSVTATSSASGTATGTFVAPSSNGSDITGYVVTSNPAGATCVVNAAAGTYSCTGLTNGTSYTFTIVATNAVGNSSGGTSGAVTPQGAASAVSTISAVGGDSSAVVTFSGAVANGSTITGYTVQAYDSTGSAVTGATCTVTTAATSGSCTVSGLTNGSEYTFKAVTTSTANSTSAPSVASIASAAVTPAKAPDAPTGITATAGTGKVIVGWTEPADNGSAITSYTVRAYDSAGNAVTGATCVATAPATTCDVSNNLVAGSAYTFKVTATSAAGTSTASSASTSASINAAPSVPRNVTAEKGNTTATVSWDAPLDIRGSEITGYTVTAYTSGNNVAGTCTAVAPIETCVVSGLTNGTAYTFKVTATNGIGTSLESTASLAVTPSTVPNAPTGVIAAIGDAQATITFTAPTNDGGSVVTGYTVTASNGSTISGSASPLIIAGLTNGTAYTFTVKATNINGDSLASTASSSVTPVASSAPKLETPGQPTGNPYVGSTLTSNVVFSGSPTPVITYQWKVCDDETDLASCTNISGATSATFVPTISHLDKYIRVLATATNSAGELPETSEPTLVIKPEIDFTAPSPVPGATAGSSYVLSLAAAGGVGAFAYTVPTGSLPAGLTLNPATGQLAGTPTTAGSYTFTVRATDSNGVYKDVVVTIVVAAAAPVSTPTTTPTTPVETCDTACQATRDAAATKAAADRAAADKAAADRAAADKAAADALAKAAADKAAADATAAAKAKSDADATTASTKATADAAAAAEAAKAAVERAAEASAAKIAADAAADAAAARAKAAADAQAAATRAAAEAAATLKDRTASAATKAAATASARAAANEASASVRAAATAAREAVVAKNTAAKANKQVEIAINSLNSKTAASQASAAANAIAAAAKAAANEAAAAAAAKAAEAKAAATAAQKDAAETAARIATEQKQAATAAALAKVAAEAAAKATEEKIAATNAAKAASEALVKVLEEKAALAEQAAKATDVAVRKEIEEKIEVIEVKITQAETVVEVTAEVAEEAAVQYQEAIEAAAEATEVAEIKAAEAIAVKEESAKKTAVAAKAVTDATVATKVAKAAKEAAAKVPSKAVITKKPAASNNKNSATATVTGLKPGQKVKVTVNVKPKPKP